MLRSTLITLVLALLPCAAAAQLFPAFTDTDTFSGLGFGVNTTRGWQFTVTEKLEVQELGFWDSGLDGLADPHPVGIWLDDMTLLTTATVPSGTAAALDGTFRWVSTTPVVLVPGNTYVIGAFWPASSGDTRLGGGESPSFDPRVSLTGGRLSASGSLELIFPFFSGTLELNANFKAIPAPIDPSTLPLSVSFSDVTGDSDPPINVDLVSLDLAFDPASGDYALTWRADPAQPFVGTFRLNANLYNPDTGSNEQDPAFFSDTFNDITLTAPETVITLTGNDPRLMAWGAGDRVAPSCPDPLGCPNGVSTFLSAVGPLSGSAEGLDRLPPQSSVIVATPADVPGLTAPAVGILIGVAGCMGSVLLRARRGGWSRG